MSNSIASNSFCFLEETNLLIKKYVGSTFVIKYGGSAMRDPVTQHNVIQDISLLSSLGIKIVLVHGGGYMVNSWLNKMNIEPVFNNGIRVTDSETIDIVEMVLSAKINKGLVSLFNKLQTPAVGLSGKDARLVTALPLSDDLKSFTGKVDIVDTKVLEVLLSNGLLPVVSSVACDAYGKTYNINADTIASSIAASIEAAKLIFITDIPGVLADVDNKSTLIKELDSNSINKLKLKGVIKKGMIPKIDSCLYAVNNNVESVHIIDGGLNSSLLNEIFTNSRIGSRIRL
uniref:Acetylglutamate kinase n=1 Tax=Polysiphonia sertularioides TaxID=945028 RepID=A0A1Z1MG56_9FLOR|nr:acetylglutamate kinase [Polysiphonia sertularioides]